MVLDGGVQVAIKSTLTASEAELAYNNAQSEGCDFRVAAPDGAVSLIPSHKIMLINISAIPDINPHGIIDNGDRPKRVREVINAKDLVKENSNEVSNVESNSPTTLSDSTSNDQQA